MEKTKKKPKIILVPTDFSVTCENAFKHAVKLANHPETRIFLLHVIEDKPPKYPRDVREEYERVHEYQKMNTLLEEFIATHEAKNVEPIVRKGNLFETINNVAEEIKADLIVLGTHGKSGMQKIFGSYALKVIDHTNVPVLVVHEEPHETNNNNIVFPLGLLEKDRQKAKLAVEYAKDYDAQIHVILEHPKTSADKIKAEAVQQQIISYFTTHQIQFSIRVSNFNDKEFEKDIEVYSQYIDANFILVLSSPDNHFIFGGGKEESYIFNKSHIPILCITSHKFTTTGTDSAFSGAYY